MTKVELFELIRKDYHHHQKSIRQIARERHIHRRMVRQAIVHAIPPQRKKSHRTSHVLTQAHKLCIEQWVLDDITAPKKQRHTGERVYRRLVESHHYQGSSGTVRNYFYQARKLVNLPNKVFIPQCYQPGGEAEVDWYEAMVDFPTGRQKVYIFQMRACYSGREFHIAFFRQNQQCFLEAHIAAFEYFGGIFKEIRYDNLSSAVAKVLRGRRRIETQKFIALRSHYLFDAVFCQPGIKGAHEKGGVEGGVGRFRRAHFVPVPKVDSLQALNALLRRSCHQDDQRTIRGQSAPVCQRWQAELAHLQSLPNERFDTADVLTPVVNTKSLMAIKGNYYSVPTPYVGQTVEARVYAQHIMIYKQGKRLAQHPRCYGQHQMVIELDHYLALLRHKPGALKGSVALAQAKQQQKWPKQYDSYWRALKKRYPDHQANRAMVDMLWWARAFAQVDVNTTLEQALACGSLSLDTLRVLMRQHQKPDTKMMPLYWETHHPLYQYNRPLSKVKQYDRLLAEGATS